jgi:hypothetical protein
VPSNHCQLCKFASHSGLNSERKTTSLSPSFGCPIVDRDPESNVLKALVDAVIFLTFLISFILRFLETDSGQDEPFESKEAARIFYGWVLIASIFGALVSGVALTLHKIARHKAATASFPRSFSRVDGDADDEHQFASHKLGGTAGGYVELQNMHPGQLRAGNDGVVTWTAGPSPERSPLLSSEQPEPEENAAPGARPAVDRTHLVHSSGQAPEGSVDAALGSDVDYSASEDVERLSRVSAEV